MATLTTPKFGFPYPDGAERVMDGDNAMGALALAVEGMLHPYLVALKPLFYRATGPLVMSNAAEVLVPGLTTTFTVPAGSDELALVIVSFDFNVSTAGVGACTGMVYLDGNSRGGGAAFVPPSTARETVFNLATCALPPGPHTIEARARKTIGAGVANVESVGLSLGAVSSSFMVVMRFKNIAP